MSRIPKVSFPEKVRTKLPRRRKGIAFVGVDYNCLKLAFPLYNKGARLATVKKGAATFFYKFCVVQDYKIMTSSQPFNSNNAIKKIRIASDIKLSRKPKDKVQQR